MLNNSAMCRRQAAYHRQVAAASPLEKVRRIALAAANAWEVQAMEAEAQESGERGMLSAQDAAIALELHREDEEKERAHMKRAAGKTAFGPLQRPIDD
ncbi:MULTISPECIES: hypothetical protein [Sphingobium]|uniref:hypothetical protein n=1 Tax=Sphingobium TaxID=165695 RepID=UPI001C3FCECB|nr:hypothetical protein [Sphingobium sp. 15-1]